MKKLFLFILMCLLPAMILLGCVNGNPEQTSTITTMWEESGAWVCPPSVMIDGKMYRDWSLEPVIDPNAIAESQILGYITSEVSITTVPTQDNEANYSNAMGAPYARWTDEEYGEVYVIKYGYGWHVLLPEDYPIS